MSVRHGLLALLAEGPSYGYQLRTRLEARTGGTWPLNIGQVYTTLSRLERDGLVEATGADGQATYRITEAGRAAVAAWFAGPVDRPAAVRDELAIKLALAVDSPAVDASRIVRVQRAATARAVRELVGLRSGADAGADLAWTLVLDALIFQAEAELRWLDQCEDRIAARQTPTARLPVGSQAADGAGPAEPD